MFRQFNVLLIEDDLSERDGIRSMLVGLMPEGVTLIMQWRRSIESGLQHLLSNHQHIDLIICHDVQPEKGPTDEQKRRLVVVERRSIRHGEVHRLMTCMSALAMNHPHLVGLVERGLGARELQCPLNYHGPQSFLSSRECEHDWESVRALVRSLAQSTLVA